MSKISIVIPVYNEAESVAELHAEIVSVMKTLPHEYEIIFVDDGSTDGTFDILQTLRPCRATSFSRNFGKSQALQAGFDEAEGDYVITLDGDLQDDPREIARFIEEAERGADLVCGWKVKRVDSFSKRILSKIANLAARKVTGVDVHDMNCCFKIYSRDAAKALELYGDMHRYIPSILAGMGFSIKEIPVNHRSRKYGSSKYGFSRLANGLFDFITLFLLRKFLDRPMHFFGRLGILSGFVGSLMLGYLSWIKIFNGAIIGNRPLLMLGILLVVTGFQSFSLGFLGEIVIRQRRDRKSYIVRANADNR